MAHRLGQPDRARVMASQALDAPAPPMIYTLWRSASWASLLETTVTWTKPPATSMAAPRR